MSGKTISVMADIVKVSAGSPPPPVVAAFAGQVDDPLRCPLALLLEEDDGKEDPALPSLGGEDEPVAVVDAVSLHLVEILHQVAGGPQAILTNDDHLGVDAQRVLGGQGVDLVSDDPVAAGVLPEPPAVRDALRRGSTGGARPSRVHDP